jgi:hypothetical protein
MSTMVNTGKPTYLYKRFRVKRPDGGSTTVSVEPALVVKACKAIGSLNEVGKIVRESAIAFETERLGKSRSAHVAKRLEDIIKAKAAATESTGDMGIVGV